MKHLKLYESFSEDVSKFEKKLERKYNVVLDLLDYKNGDIVLSKIVVPKEDRNSGLGGKIMQEIVEYADKNKRRIVLTPSTDFGGTSVDRLKEFYKRFDFVENKGKHKEFNTTSSMYRNPKINESFVAAKHEIHPAVLEVLKKYLVLDGPTLKALHVVMEPAFDMAHKGSSVPMRTSTHGQERAALILRDRYFPNSAKFVNADVFDKLAKGKTIYYRGVSKPEYIEELEFGTKHFMGHSSIFQGTWMTNDKEYASHYHYDKTNPLQILLSPDARIITERHAMLKRDELVVGMHNFMNKVSSEIDDEESFKEQYYQAMYIKDYVSHTLVTMNGGKTDGVLLDTGKDKSVLVMFNREKLTVRKAE
jgi:hypothetical protein